MEFVTQLYVEQEEAVAQLDVEQLPFVVHPVADQHYVEKQALEEEVAIQLEVVEQEAGAQLVVDHQPSEVHPLAEQHEVEE